MLDITSDSIDHLNIKFSVVSLLNAVTPDLENTYLTSIVIILSTDALAIPVA